MAERRRGDTWTSSAFVGQTSASKIGETKETEAQCAGAQVQEQTLLNLSSPQSQAHWALRAPPQKANSFLSSAPPGARTDIISQGKATNCFRTSIWFLLTEAQLRPGRVKWDTGTGMARKNTKVAWKMQKWVSGTGASGIAWPSSSLFVLGLVSFGCWVSSFHRGLWEEATCFLPYDSEQTGNLKQNQKHPTGNPNTAFITNKVWVGGCCLVWKANRTANSRMG